MKGYHATQERQCPNCGEWFLPGQHNQLYCSRQCGQQYRERQNPPRSRKTPPGGNRDEEAYGPETAYLIRLWYYGECDGHRSMRRLTLRQIARLMGRSIANVKLALLEEEDAAF